MGISLKAAFTSAKRRMNQLRKFVWQWYTLGKESSRQPVFIFGCQRSGTSMLVDTLGKSPHVFTFKESRRSPAFENHRIKSPEIVQRLIDRSYAMSVVFKPICDSQNAPEILDQYKGAKGIWIYRNYADVVNSAVRKWGRHQREVISDLVMNNKAKIGWRGERVGEEMRDEIADLYSDDLTDFDGSALFWYLRNVFFFERGLQENDNVILVNYSDLVRNPERGFKEIFDFAGVEFECRYVSDIHASSVGRNAPPPLSDEIRERCEGLQRRLESHAVSYNKRAI